MKVSASDALGSPGASGAFHTQGASKCWQGRKLKARFKATWHIIASRPHVIIVPLALTALMMGLGIWGVIAGADHNAYQYRTKAEFHVQAVASAMQLSIQQAVMPALQVADWIEHTLNYTTVQELWQTRVASWWKKAAPASMSISLAPGGISSNVFPFGPGAEVGVGIDVLSDPLLGPMAFKSMMNGGVSVYAMKAVAKLCSCFVMSITGPFMFQGLYLMGFSFPIFIQNVSESETFGIPVTSKSCPPSLCYNAATRTKWWGITGLTVNASSFLETDVLANLGMAGYHMQVWRPGLVQAGEAEKVVVSEHGERPQPADAVRGVLPVADSEWEVYVWVDSWEPNWKTPLLIVVVVVSVVCGCLIFAVLLSWEEHRLLLHSILPVATINRMRDGMEWMQPVNGRDTLRVVEIETPAQHMQTIIRAFLAGETPPMALVVAVQQALQRSADVYRPANQDVESRINAGNLDSDVQRALVQQLAGRIGSTLPPPEAPDTDLHLSEPEDDGTPYCRPLTSQDLTLYENKPSGELLSGQDLARTSVPLPNKHRAPRNARQSCEVASTPTCPDLHTMLGALVARPNSAQVATIDSGSGYLIPASGSGNGSSSRRMSAMSPGKAMGAPEKPIMDQLDRVLNNASTWAFDVFELDEITQGHSLSVLGYWLMHNSGCMEFAHMDGRVLSRFLRRVEDGYKSNPYHNSRHAADVLQTFHVILQQGGLVPGYCDQLTLLGCYLAAIVHDYEHIGCTNDYLIGSRDKLAVRYNDRSPMENHHLAAAWGLLLQPGFDCLSGLSKSNWDKLRKLVIELVLATDMRQHFAILSQFSMLHATTATPGAALNTSDSGSSAPSVKRSLNGAPPSEPGSRPSAGPPGSILTTRQSISQVPASDNDKLLSLQVALKCADIGNLAAPLPVYQRWVGCLEEEMFLQGDAERTRGMTISPLCDRTKEGVSKSQVGFFDFVVLPLFSNFTQKFKASKPLLNAVVANYRFCQNKAAQASKASSAGV